VGGNTDGLVAVQDSGRHAAGWARLWWRCWPGWGCGIWCRIPTLRELLDRLGELLGGSGD